MSRPRSRRPISTTRYVRPTPIPSRETDTRIRAIEPNVPMDSHDTLNQPVNKRLASRRRTLTAGRSRAAQAEINRLRPSRASNTGLKPRGETSVRGLDEYSVMVRVARQRYSRTAVWRFILAGIVPQRSWRVRVHRDGCERCAGTRSVPIVTRGVPFDARTPRDTRTRPFTVGLLREICRVSEGGAGCTASIRVSRAVSSRILSVRTGGLALRFTSFETETSV